MDVFEFKLATGKGFNATLAGFFDRPGVLKALDAYERRVLSRFGAFVRRRAKSSIRARKAVSEPGMPPSSHEGSLRQFIFFGYDPASRSVVVGPTQSRAGSDVPRLLEEGGEALRRSRGGARLLHYRARPFMRPAFDAEKRLNLARILKEAQLGSKTR